MGMKNLFAKEKEDDFKLEKFLFVHYEELKHFNITTKIFEIFQMNLNNNLVLEKDIADLTDEFSDTGEQREFTDVYVAPELLTKNSLLEKKKVDIEIVDLQEQKKENFRKE